MDPRNPYFRRHPRKKVAVTFRVRHGDDETLGDLWFDAADLGSGGAFLRSDLLLEVDETVFVDFDIPGREQPISVKARVAWSTRGGLEQEPGMGLQFLEISDEEKETVVHFLQRESREESDA